MIKNKIGMILKERGITGYRLAEDMGKRSNHVYTNIINKEDIGGMRVETLVAVAAALNVSIEELITVTK